MRILKGLGVVGIVIILADLAAFVQMVASISPISVNSLRFTTGHQSTTIIGNSIESRQSRREFQEDNSKRSSQSAS